MTCLKAVATINLLIKRGADLDLIDNRGQSALMTAARQNHLTLYELLLAAGADPALKDKEGLTANDWLQKARTDKG